MISEIRIQNFKSIEDLTLKLGRVTVLIGENGSGKSNILEAIAFAEAAATGKLDREFLFSRGIRVPEKDFMTSAFPVDDGVARNDTVEISVSAVSSEEALNLKISPRRRPEDNSIAGWATSPPVLNIGPAPKLTGGTMTVSYDDILKSLLESNASDTVAPGKHADRNVSKITQAQIETALKKLVATHTVLVSQSAGLAGFLIYAPENSTLRAFDPESAIEPLGFRGEGLLKLLQSFADEKYAERLAELKEYLHLFGWFQDFILPSTEDTVRDRLNIMDRWLAPDRAVFDQKSANEGFLYVLFYFALMISWRTPKFFAIDNVDTALNPKLCWAMMERIVKLAKQYEKQVICTTHNPAILDGLNLNDDEQRLYAVRRDGDGRTRLRRVHPPESRTNEAPLPLSEAFTRGLIGGLPPNF